MNEYDMQRLISHVEDVRLEIARSEAAQLDRSGSDARLLGSGLGAMAAGFDAMASRLEVSLGFLEATTARGFESVIDQLAGVATQLDKLASLAAHPTEVAATELRNRGLYALEQGWSPDAVADLNRATEVFPYDPLTHLALGLAHSRQHDILSAAGAFEKAAQYSGAREPRLTVTAAQLAAERLGSIGSQDRRKAVLAAAFKAVPDAAELAFNLAEFEPDMLVCALRLDPDLAVAARDRGLPNLEQAAAVVLAEPTGLERRYARALEIDRSATELPSDAPLQTSAVLSILPREVPASATLIALGALLPAAAAHLQNLAERATALAARRRGDALSQVAKLQAAPPSPGPVTRAEPKAPQPYRGTRVLSGWSVGAIAAVIVSILIFSFGENHYSGGSDGGGDLARSLLGLFVFGVSAIVVIIWFKTIITASGALRQAAKARAAYRNELFTYQAQVKKHDRRMNDYRIADRKRQGNLAKAQDNAARENLVCSALDTLSDQASRLSAELTLHCTRGLSFITGSGKALRDESQ